MQTDCPARPAAGAGAGAAGFGSRDSDGGGSPSGKYPAAEELSEIQRHYLTMGGNYDASTGVFTNPNGTTEQIAPKAQ